MQSYVEPSSISWSCFCLVASIRVVGWFLYINQIIGQLSTVALDRLVSVERNEIFKGSCSHTAKSLGNECMNKTET